VVEREGGARTAGEEEQPNDDSSMILISNERKVGN